MCDLWLACDRLWLSAHLLNGMDRTVCNALVASVPRHPFWMHVLNFVKGNANSGSIIVSTICWLIGLM